MPSNNSKARKQERRDRVYSRALAKTVQRYQVHDKYNAPCGLFNWECALLHGDSCPDSL